MVAASLQVLPHVTAIPERHSSHLARTRSRSIRQQERGHHGMGAEGVDEMAGIFVVMVRCFRNRISPLVGEMSAKQTEGGMVPLVSRALILGRFTPLCHLR